ncbi:MAG: ATP-binding cassette domain-containing protein, partial [Spirochaetes bacterium]|nr:ATP-binding cassette domain-containing protein [Spirochaetota bacterium]
NFEVSKKNTLIEISKKSIPLSLKKSLQIPDLFIKPAQKIGITGPNGSGKSTLIRYILYHLTLPKEKILYIPQEVQIDQATVLKDQIHQLADDKLGSIMITIARLGSEPKRLLFSPLPSPGETKKILLAMGLLKTPQIIIMDEPTNHLDLEAIVCLENFLKNCPIALLLVSHDIRFLNSLMEINWKIEKYNENCYLKEEPF